MPYKQCIVFHRESFGNYPSVGFQVCFGFSFGFSFGLSFGFSFGFGFGGSFLLLGHNRPQFKNNDRVHLHPPTPPPVESLYGCHYYVTLLQGQELVVLFSICILSVIWGFQVTYILFQSAMVSFHPYILQFHLDASWVVKQYMIFKMNTKFADLL